MSNVTTSYVRIRRRDNEHLADAEIDYLFNEVVTRHEEFGSYWVRITRKYRKNEKCLDIQFGSGKTAARHIKWLPDLHKTYYVVERFNDDGPDTIFEYAQEAYGNDILVQTTPHRPCQYKFDQILVTSDGDWEQKIFADITKPNHARRGGCLYRIGGLYHCSNSRGYLDAYEDESVLFSTYEEDYAYDYFVFKPTDYLELISPPALVDLQQNNFEKLPEHAGLTFICKGREVLKVSKAGGRIQMQSADHWDNCHDEIYHSDMKAINDGLHPGMRMLYEQD
jgi:hypothetical protein